MATPLSSARQKAAELEARMEKHGERLSIANEQYNAAQYRISALSKQLAATKGRLLAAEAQYVRVRDQLGRRAKALYMHPAAPLAAWLNMRSLGETGRQRVLSDSVLTANSNLVNSTDMLRREIRVKERALRRLNAVAARVQQDIAANRRELATELGQERGLLRGVKGEIARIIAADRVRTLASARRSGGGPVTLDEANIPPPPAPKPGRWRALSIARAQIGKPYKWGAAGPNSFDCSGLTMYAWGKVGVQLVHFAASQYEMLPKVRRTELQPGDLVFFGSPIHHEGIYEGGGIMIDAPQTGENVRRDSIYRPDYAGASRP